MDAEAAAGAAPRPADGSVRLCFPPTSRHVRLARLVASGVAAEVGFTVDEIDDLRIAVDELAHLLVEAGGTAPVELSFLAAGGRLVVEGRRHHVERDPPIDGLVLDILAVTTDGWQIFPAGDGLGFRLERRAASPS